MIHFTTSILLFASYKKVTRCSRFGAHMVSDILYQDEDFFDELLQISLSFISPVSVWLEHSKTGKLKCLNQILYVNFIMAQERIRLLTTIMILLFICC